MAHRLEQFADGDTAFFSAREVAWHKLGTVTEGALTAEQALETAFLNWEVIKSENPIFTTVPKSKKSKDVVTITDPDKFMTYRYHPKTGTADPLGVVGTRYTPVQNAEAFSFLNTIADESGAVFETAGAIDNGRKVFMTMKMPNDVLIGGKDAINMYLMAWNTHDGTSSFNVLVTPVRVVCQNTLSYAIKQAQHKFAIRHTSSAQGKIQAAREALTVTFKYQEEFQIEAEKLFAQSMSDKEFQKIVEKAFPLDKTDTQRAQTMAINAQSALLGLWKAPTQANIKNTAWAAYNAFVEYSDWARPVRGKDADVARAERVVNGSGERFKNRILSLIS
jgi:phage/plasmid-like protein (TIGR03299 family)